ncbi:MAG: DUF6020 family protein [Lachnospiraceae bacterium]
MKTILPPHHKMQLVFRILQCFFITFAGMRIFQIEATNLLTLIFPLLSYLLLSREMPIEKQTHKIYVSVLSAVYTLFYVCGSYRKILSGLDNRGFQIIFLTLTALGLFCLFRLLILFFLQALSSCYTKINLTGSPLARADLPENNHAASPKDTDAKMHAKFVFLFTFLFCMIAWLPYFLKNYPGVMNIDSINQYAQVIGAWQQSNHHPWWHTMMIKLFYSLGLAITGSPVHAIAFYTIFQMMLMAAVAAYGVQTLFSVAGLSRRWCFITAGIFALLPFNAFFAVTVWKDAAFAAGVLLYTICIFRLCRQKMNPLLFGISCLMLSLFRNNGWYVFLCMIPVLFIAFRKQWKSVATILILSLAVLLVMKGSLMQHFGVAETEITESLSIPLQQMARVVKENGSLTQQESEYLESIMGMEAMRNAYHPVVSDNIKNLAKDRGVLQDNLGEFFRNYISIGLHNPGAYLRGYIDQTYGFYFPESTILVGGDEYIIPNEFGIYSIPLLKGPVIVKIHELNLKLKQLLPGYGLLWCMGANFWIILFFSVFLLVQNRGKEALVLLPGILIAASLMVASPVAEDFRYAYSYIFCMPFYFGILFSSSETCSARHNRL